jgi:hypothetical protein
MKGKYVFFYPFDHLHDFLVESLVYAMNAESTKHGDELIQRDFQENDILVYVMHPLYMLKNEEMLLWKKVLNQKRMKKILYISEPLTLMIERKTYQYLLREYQISEIWTYTKGNLSLFTPLYRQPFFRMAPFYNPYFDWIDKDWEKYQRRRRDKIVFIGNLSNARKGILEEMGEDVVHITNIWTKEDWKRVLEEYLYFVNIHRIPKCGCMETLRILPILANGGIVLSEKVNEGEMEEMRDINLYFEERENISKKWFEIKNWGEDQLKKNYKQWNFYCEHFTFEKECVKIKNKFSNIESHFL